MSTFPPGQVVADSTLDIHIRKIKETSIDSFRRIADYNYQLDPKYESNLIKRLWLTLIGNLDRSFREGTSRILGKLLYYGLILLAICALIWFFLKRSGAGIFHRKREGFKLSIEEINESNSLQEIESLLSVAIGNLDFRLATRLYFLRTLRLLDNADRISWKSGKTNYDYANEIENLELKKGFVDVTYIYDYVWYGDFEIDSEASFNRIQHKFQAFSEMIKGEVK